MADVIWVSKHPSEMGQWKRVCAVPIPPEKVDCKFFACTLLDYQWIAASGLPSTKCSAVSINAWTANK